jgi:hypothetical protein
MTMKLTIPPIDDARLAALAARIRPAVHAACPGGHARSLDEIWYIQPPRDLRDVSFLWNAVPRARIDRPHHLRTLHTLHEYGAPSLFKPSVAEVLAQLPPDIEEHAVAFTTVGFDNVTAMQAVPHGHAALQAGFHLGVTTFYGTTESELATLRRLFPRQFEK